MVKDKTLNLFGAPIPKDTLIKYYDKLEKMATEKDWEEVDKETDK